MRRRCSAVRICGNYVESAAGRGGAGSGIVYSSLTAAAGAGAAGRNSRALEPGREFWKGRKHG